MVSSMPVIEPSHVLYQTYVPVDGIRVLRSFLLCAGPLNPHNAAMQLAALALPVPSGIDLCPVCVALMAEAWHDLKTDATEGRR
jgi:hypothetical protein